MDTMISHRISLAEAPEIFTQIGNHTLNHRKIMMQPEGAKA
jgi:threonine dehydrogenase-like Zn-dependent dehydrogenase